MKHRSNAVAAILPFRICGARAGTLAQIEKGKSVRMTHRSNAAAITPAVSVRFLGGLIFTTRRRPPEFVLRRRHRRNQQSARSQTSLQPHRAGVD